MKIEEQYCKCPYNHQTVIEAAECLKNHLRTLNPQSLRSHDEWCIMAKRYLVGGKRCIRWQWLHAHQLASAHIWSWDYPVKIPPS